MTAVTTHSDFGAQENKIYHYFYFFPLEVAGAMQKEALVDR